MKRFEDIEVYKKAFALTIAVFKLTNSRTFDLNVKNQIQRSALSIPLNIAEGFELQSNKQFIKFLYISKASSGELRSLLRICEELNYIDKTIIDDLLIETEDVSKQLSKFISYLKNSKIE